MRFSRAATTSLLAIAAVGGGAYAFLPSSSRAPQASACHRQQRAMPSSVVVGPLAMSSDGAVIDVEKKTVDSNKGEETYE